MRPWPARAVTRLGLLAGTGVILFVLESLAPRPLPWLRLGLGNLPVLVALLLYGSGAALCVSLVKILLGGLFSGALGGPATAMALGAGLSSLAAMALVRRWAPRVFSPVGLSIVGAVVHQVAQLALAARLVGHSGAFALLPLALLAGLTSGAGIGLLAAWTWRRLQDPFQGPGR
jgi:heptaprenyl diphosphate synthase